VVAVLVAVALCELAPEGLRAPLPDAA
jgi:hypothetical protein